MSQEHFAVTPWHSAGEYNSVCSAQSVTFKRIPLTVSLLHCIIHQCWIVTKYIYRYEVLVCKSFLFMPLPTSSQRENVLLTSFTLSDSSVTVVVTMFAHKT